MATAELETVLRRSDGYDGTVDAYAGTAEVELEDVGCGTGALDEIPGVAEGWCGATARCVARHPFEAIAVTLVAGFIAGAAVRLIGGRRHIQAVFRDA